MREKKTVCMEKSILIKWDFAFAQVCVCKRQDVFTAKGGGEKLAIEPIDHTTMPFKRYKMSSPLQIYLALDRLYEEDLPLARKREHTRSL